jgi:hypothetical protein
MTTILRVIPNSLYERLFDDGYIEDTYPSEKQNDLDLLVKNIPLTLRDRAKNILKELRQVISFSWTADGQLVTNKETIQNSNISDLLKHLVFQSNKLYSLPGSQQFLLAVSNIPCNLYKLPPTIESCTPDITAKSSEDSWINFDDKFNLNG